MVTWLVIYLAIDHSGSPVKCVMIREERLY